MGGGVENHNDDDGSYPYDHYEEAPEVENHDYGGYCEEALGFDHSEGVESHYDGGDGDHYEGGDCAGHADYNDGYADYNDGYADDHYDGDYGEDCGDYYGDSDY